LTRRRTIPKKEISRTPERGQNKKKGLLQDHNRGRKGKKAPKKGKTQGQYNSRDRSNGAMGRTCRCPSDGKKENLKKGGVNARNEWVRKKSGQGKRKKGKHGYQSNQKRKRGRKRHLLQEGSLEKKKRTPRIVRKCEKNESSKGAENRGG